MILVVGASGSGKDTIVKRLIEKYGYKKPVPYTTRDPRDGEVDGVHYHFVSKERFEQLVSENFFAEHAPYDNNYYGTPWDAIKDDVIKIIEPIGLNALRLLDKNAVTVYIEADETTRENRMVQRGDKKEDVDNRLCKDINIFTTEIMNSCDIIVDNTNRISDEKIESIHSSITCVLSFLNEPRPFFKIAI